MKVESKITKETYTNRYGNEFVFTLLEDGNILWEGEFEHYRFNVDSEDRITMVDPIGGPYLQKGMEQMGKTIKEFIPDELGFIITTQ